MLVKSNVFCLSLHSDTLRLSESTLGCIAIESIRQCRGNDKNVYIAAREDAIHTLIHTRMRSMEIRGHGRNVGNQRFTELTQTQCV